MVAVNILVKYKKKMLAIVTAKIGFIVNVENRIKCKKRKKYLICHLNMLTIIGI